MISERMEFAASVWSRLGHFWSLASDAKGSTDHVIIRPLRPERRKERVSFPHFQFAHDKCFKPV